MEKYYYAALSAFLGYQAPARAPRLTEIFGSARSAWNASREEIRSTGLVPPRLLERWHSGQADSLPEKIYDYCEKHGTELLVLGQEGYPEALSRISSPPPVLYVQGLLPCFEPCAAVVGSRKATEYGLTAAGLFARALAESGVPVVSGGAYGIDACAHKSALRAKGRTVAVLGGGFDHLYPAGHRALFAQIAEHGAVVTEYAPWVEPLGRQFPMRNRIIVGLSRLVLVVEAALKSGAMITAHLAAEENREVWSVPGPITSETSKGTNHLLKEGAHPATAPEEILAALGCGGGTQADLYHREPSLFQELPQEEGRKSRLLYQYLQTHPGRTLDELAEAFSWPLAALNMLLLQLEMAGLVTRNLGGHYQAV